MEAGRELDALIAEKVMGWPAFAPQVLDKLSFHVFGERDPCLICGRDESPYKECLPYYSTSIASAWEVVEKLLESKFSIQLLAVKERGALAKFVAWTTWDDGTYQPKGSWEAEALTAPHAICLAALKALESKS